MSEHVLVTGGAGFIGSALINELNAHGFTTSSFDLHPNHSVSGYEITRDLLTASAFSIELQMLNEKLKVDRVVHLAAQVGRLFGEDDLVHTVRSNAEMTTIVANACGRMGIPLVYCSTSEVYGDWSESSLPLHEDGQMRLPHNLYGLTKRWGEEAARLYAPEGLIIWRPSMPYGPGAPPGRGRRAMDNMLWQANHRMPITVHLGAIRSWCWLGDTVRAMRLTIENGNARSYNIGRDDDPRSMLEIARRACELAGAPESLIEMVDPPRAQTVVKHLSTEKIRQLGWEPEVDLDEGMELLFRWIKQFDENGVLAA